ncbi:hypothetical protein AK830_g11931 [Neonectria ditissima]|uniref:non-specific serine/threonine protein kinase n=1 Tax=Neonectria ditissima TaxID=78410 RepID=A0A0P7B1G0_9HYPO|nr:hypothetical protein AK830_g11931 [Neonectria ditissima]
MEDPDDLIARIHLVEHVSTQGEEPTPQFTQSAWKLTFTTFPRKVPGFRLGSHKDCEIVLSGDLVDEFHAAITFDRAGRLIVRDLGSRRGTEVAYGDKKPGWRKNFSWIIGGASFIKGKPIFINLPGLVSLKVVVRDHSLKLEEYLEKVDEVCPGLRAPDDNLEASSATRQRVGANDIHTQPMHLEEYLNQGAFGTVVRCWNVTDGTECAVKRPAAICGKKVDRKLWKKEIRLLRLAQHPHIVQLLHATLDPIPEMRLEYASGVARWYHGFNTQQNPFHTSSVFIRFEPANTLVYINDNNGIYIKLGDFGLSRDASELETQCGTSKYIAPEIHSMGDESSDVATAYTAKVDVWSLGVMVYELMGLLPQTTHLHENYRINWCKKIVIAFQNDRKKWELDWILYGLKGMLVLSPESRLSAGACYDLLEQLVESSGQVPINQNPAADIEHGGSVLTQTTVRPRRNDHVDEGQGANLGPTTSAPRKVKSHHQLGSSLSIRSRPIGEDNGGPSAAVDEDRTSGRSRTIRGDIGHLSIVDEDRMSAPLPQALARGSRNVESDGPSPSGRSAKRKRLT